jgi:hypothetical protein
LYGDVQIIYKYHLSYINLEIARSSERSSICSLQKVKGEVNSCI